MFTAALIGPDGVGKTTVARRVEERFPFPIRYVYMGDNFAASQDALPTTRWWKSLAQSARRAPVSAALRASERGRLRTLRKTLGFVNRSIEQLRLQHRVRRQTRRGVIVLMDRHFRLDYYHEDHGPDRHRRPLKRRLEGLFRSRFLDLPDLVICLDAPGEVVFARKGEFGVEHLAQRRRQYLDFGRVVPHFEVVDADRPLPEVVDDVEKVLLAFRRRRDRVADGSAPAR